MQAVVLWTKENKASVEPKCNVPENARFVGAVTPVRFSGDKRWYPAKIIMLSDDAMAVEKKCKEIAEEIAKKNNESQVVMGKGKRKAKKTRNTGSTATEQEVARALGTKAPVLAHLEQASSATQKAKKANKISHRQGQDSLDLSVMSLGRSSSGNQGRKAESRQDRTESDHESIDENDEDDPERLTNAEDLGDSNDEDGPDDSKDNSDSEKWCSCGACLVLKKYDNVLYHNFLTDMCKLYASPKRTTKKFLALRAILPGTKQVELASGTGVFIEAESRDEIRVDFKNKPSSLVRETLFALYGKEQFKVLSVTARGSKPGSYGLEDSVLKALVSFVNRNVEPKKQVTFKSLVTTINKRAPEWRRNVQSPAETSGSKGSSKAKARHLSPNLKVTSTSPFKCTPMKSPTASNTAASSTGNGSTVARSLFEEEGQGAAKGSATLTTGQGAAFSTESPPKTVCAQSPPPPFAGQCPPQPFSAQGRRPPSAAQGASPSECPPSTSAAAPSTGHCPPQPFSAQSPPPPFAGCPPQPFSSQGPPPPPAGHQPPYYGPPQQWPGQQWSGQPWPWQWQQQQHQSHYDKYNNQWGGSETSEGSAFTSL